MVKSKISLFVKEIFVNRAFYIMFLPLALWYIIFAYIPMGGIVLAFKDFNYKDGVFGSPWVGLKNFEFFFTSGKAWIVTKNTAIYNLMFIFFYQISSIFIAILVSEIGNKWFKKISQTFILLPHFISWVVISAIVYNYFNSEFGFVNVLLRNLGIQEINIYTEPVYWRFLLPFLYVWKHIGYGNILYLAAIMGIDKECYESAEIDGASIIKRIYYITLPSLRPTIVTLVLLALGRILRGDFEMFYQLVGKNGLLMEKTDIVDTMAFRSLVVSADFGMSAAIGFYQSILCFIFIITVNTIVKKLEPDYSLF